MPAPGTWDGGNASGAWSQGGTGGNWNGSSKPASGVDVNLVFATNTNGQVSNNDITNPYELNRMTFSNTVTLAGYALKFSGSSPTVDVVNAAASVIISNNLQFVQDQTWLQGSGTGLVAGVVSEVSAGKGLTKGGTGLWMLDNANTYSGLTTVKAGTLALGSGGSIGNSSGVQVYSGALFDVSVPGSGFTLASGQTLSGNGTVKGSLTAASGSTNAPGMSIGTLTTDLGGGKTAVFAAGAVFAFDLGSPGTGDVLAFTGLTADTTSVTFNGNTVNFSSPGGLDVGTYTLFTFDAAGAYSGTLSVGTGLELFSPTFIYNANSIQLQVAAGSNPLSTITVTNTTDGAEEGPVNGAFTISRDNVGTNLPVTVYYTVAGTATAGSDYTDLTGISILGVGETNATIFVPVLQDADFNEGAETVILRLTANAAYSVGDSSNATVTISDGIKPVVTITNTADGAEEGPVNGGFIVSRPATGEATNYALVVNYTVDVASTAQTNSDYTALSGSVIIPAGHTNAPIIVTVKQDSNFDEGTETVILNLTAEAAYTVGDLGSATVNITDGVKPVVTLVKKADGTEEGPVNGSFTLSRPAGEATNYALTVYCTITGTATMTNDYTAFTTNLAFAAGATNATVNVAVLKDTDFAEGNETVMLDILPNLAYTVGDPASATVNIADATQPVITLVKTSDGSEYGPVEGGFALSRQPESMGSAVTVYIAVTGSATPGSDYTAFLTNVTLLASATNYVVPVLVLRDAVYGEGTETVQLDLIPNGFYAMGDSSNAIVNITDDVAPSVGEKRDFTALYTFSNSVNGLATDPTPPPYEKGIVFGSFAMVGGAKIGVNGSAGQFVADGWDGSITNQVTDRYFEVKLTPVDKAVMTITNITFDVCRQKDQGTIPVGPARWALRSSLDNYAANMATMSISPPTNTLSVVATETVLIGAAPATMALQSGSMLTLDASFAAITNALTLRIYGWENGGDTDGGIDNFAIRGIWAVPAPSGTLILFW
ncbi:MAG: Calx-beta domain-containing protein [bacterium]